MLDLKDTYSVFWWVTLNVNITLIVYQKNSIRHLENWLITVFSGLLKGFFFFGERRGKMINVLLIKS